jgi:hypothetical protein
MLLKCTHISQKARPTFDVQVSDILQTQGGGHGKIRKGSANVPCIAKPLIPREDMFYKQTRMTPLANVIPSYCGSTENWLLLQDLTAGMSSPCIADLKLGTRSFELNAPPEKVCRQLSHIVNTTTQTHAVRCIDICVRKEGRVVQRWGRRQGHSMTIDQLQSCLQLFLPGNRRRQFLRAIFDLKEALVQTQVIFPNLRLYSASVLAVYDGDKDGGQVSVKLIDFAHAYIDIAAEGGMPGDPSFDDNSINGLESMIALLIN